jgi:hypothetical protein
MKTFKDLEFRPHPYEKGVHAIIEFNNGYGASIIKTPTTYGGASGLYELAVLKDDDICYTTPITNDVLGWLNEQEINNILLDIQNLSN